MTDVQSRYYLRQGLADNGGVYIEDGETATGDFVAIVSLGGTTDGNITGTTIVDMECNLVDANGDPLTSIFLPTGFTLTGWFRSVEVDGNSTDRLICMNAPKDTQ